VHRFKWFLSVIAVAVIVAVSIVVFLPPRVTVHGEGKLAIANTMAQEPPQFDIISISDIPAYGVIETSGCGEFKGKVKIRIDCFLTPESSYYSQYGGAFVVDTASKEYLAGYKGARDDKTGEPLDWDAYNKWLDGLPTVWQDNPFHSHFVYYDTTVLDDSIKAKIASVTEYFYAFHTYCWDNELTFLSQWVKVPKVAGTIRDVFTAGDISPPNKDACEVKAIDIVTRTLDFDTRVFDETPAIPPPLGIGEKGTIDVGVTPDDFNGYFASNYTAFHEDNPANADGTIDTVQYWFDTNSENVHGVIVGFFFNVSGTTYECRSSESIGDVAKGSLQQTTGLELSVSTNDFIGLYCTAGRLEMSWNLGGIAYNYKGGEHIGATDQAAYSRITGRLFALYGTGTESGGDPDISNTPSTWAVGTVATSTDYWSSGSEPSWPLDDGECHFTVTNNGDTCSMTVKGTNFTGGVGWTLAGSPAENTVTMKAGKSGDANEGAFITLTTSEQSFIAGLAGSGTKKWELMMESPTNHTDGALKTATITLTATLD